MNMLSQKLRRAVHNVFSRPVENSPAKRLEAFMILWRSFAGSPSCIYDVGANCGNWTRSAHKVFPDATYYLFEPQRSLNSYLNDICSSPKCFLFNIGLSDSTGYLDLSIPTRCDSASFLKPHSVDTQSIQVPVSTLNEFVAEGHPIPNICKIDAEGYDLKVLRGASDLFGTTDAFFVEAAVCAPIIENTCASVVDFMKDHGYKLCDITDMNRSPKSLSLWLVELAFARADLSFWRNLNSYE